jgi:hypothetical protein
MKEKDNARGTWDLHEYIRWSVLPKACSKKKDNECVSRYWRELLTTISSANVDHQRAMLICLAHWLLSQRKIASSSSLVLIRD